MSGVLLELDWTSMSRASISLAVTLLCSDVLVNVPAAAFSMRLFRRPKADELVAQDSATGFFTSLAAVAGGVFGSVITDLSVWT